MITPMRRMKTIQVRRDENRNRIAYAGYVQGRVLTSKIYCIIIIYGDGLKIRRGGLICSRTHEHTTLFLGAVNFFVLRGFYICSLLIFRVVLQSYSSVPLQHDCSLKLVFGSLTTFINYQFTYIVL